MTLFFNLPLQNVYFLLKCRRVYESCWTTTWKSSLLRRTQSPLCEQNNQRSHLALTIFAHLDDSIISSRRWQHSIFSFFTRHIFYATRALIFCHCSAVWLQTAGLRLFVLCFVCCASDSKTHPPIKDDRGGGALTLRTTVCNLLLIPDNERTVTLIGKIGLRASLSLSSLFSSRQLAIYCHWDWLLMRDLVDVARKNVLMWRTKVFVHSGCSSAEH